MALFACTTEREDATEVEGSSVVEYRGAESGGSLGVVAVLS